MLRKRIVLISIILVSSVAVAGLSATTTAQAAQGQEECIPPSGYSETSGLHLTGTVDRDRSHSNQINIQYQSSQLNNAIFSIYLPKDVTVTSHSGFEKTDEGYSSIKGHTNPQISYRVNDSPPGEVNYSSTEDWLFTPIPDHQYANVSLRLQSENGYIGDEFLLIGSHRIYKKSVGCQDIELVIPMAVNSTNDASSVLTLYSNLSKSTSFGHRYTDIHVFSIPGPVNPPHTGFTRNNDIWVRSDIETDRPVWAHEYVHTNQNFRLGSRMEWFKEGSAEYLGTRLSYDEGQISKHQYNQYLQYYHGHTSSGQVLSRADESGNTSYFKGALVAAYIDQQIRENTDGRENIEVIIRRVNDHSKEGENVTYSEFKLIVANETNESVANQLDDYVLTETVPTMHSIGAASKSFQILFRIKATAIASVTEISQSVWSWIGLIGLLLDLIGAGILVYSDTGFVEKFPGFGEKEERLEKGRERLNEEGKLTVGEDGFQELKSVLRDHSELPDNISQIQAPPANAYDTGGTVQILIKDSSGRVVGGDDDNLDAGTYDRWEGPRQIVFDRWIERKIYRIEGDIRRSILKWGAGIVALGFIMQVMGYIARNSNTLF